MSSASNYGNIFRQIMISRITIRMQITMESVQKISGIAALPVGLVIIQPNGLVCISTGPIKPHIALTLGPFRVHVKPAA